MLSEGMADYKADKMKQLVIARTGLKGRELVCPRERSEMTPCIARDGHLSVALEVTGLFVCVGCGESVCVLLREEEGKHVVS